MNGQNFCPGCGAPVQAAPRQNAAPQQNMAPQQNATPGQNAGPQQMVYQGAPYQQMQSVPPAKKSKTGRIVLIVVLAAAALILVAGVILVLFVRKAARNYINNTQHEYEDLFDEDYEFPDIDTGDIDIEGLDEAIDAMNDLDFDINPDKPELTDKEPEDVPDTGEDQAAGDLTVYSYADVYRDGNQLTIIPNGGLNASTKIFNGKDLDGFLDYVDSTVLEAGRTINRDFFYDLFSVILVDKDLTTNQDYIENNMIMALAMANNFYSLDIRIEECDLDANNAAEYRLHVKPDGGRDDIWIVNFQDRTVYFNDGSTEYSSTMFKDEYLAVWFTAIEEYYGL